MTRPASFLPAVLASLLAFTGAHAASPGWEESGQASWYGGRHHGRRTSNGEVFDQNRMTAAHSTLPLGSRVRVTRQDTGASVVVIINDRQPAAGGRSIDLARGAAERIGLVQRGTGWVTLQPTAGDQPVEVAEASEGAAPRARLSPLNPPRRGPPRKPPARP